MMLVAVGMKRSYDDILSTIQDIAAETGDLHALEEIRNAIETMEKSNAGNA